MEVSYQEAIQPLTGLRLSKVGAAADMLWVQFGDLQKVTTRAGLEGSVGEWALHLQCPWRIMEESTVVLASSDFYYDADSGETHNWGPDDVSVFDRNAERLNARLESHDIDVLEIRTTAGGAFEIQLSEKLSLSVMPVNSQIGPKIESWRIFKPSSLDSHFVFEDERCTG